MRPMGNEAVVHADLRAEAAAGSRPGALLAVRVEAAADGVALRGETVVAGGAGADAATWRLEVTCRGDTRRIEQHVRLRALDPASLLDRTLHRPAHDEALAEAVAWADELRGEELACG
jgi:hypothetical protein